MKHQGRFAHLKPEHIAKMQAFVDERIKKLRPLPLKLLSQHANGSHKLQRERRIAFYGIESKKTPLEIQRGFFS